jgi:hypothetical protein
MEIAVRVNLDKLVAFETRLIDMVFPPAARGCSIRLCFDLRLWHEPRIRRRIGLSLIQAEPPLPAFTANGASRLEKPTTYFCGSGGSHEQALKRVLSRGQERIQDQPEGDITLLLGGFRKGEPEAEARLMELTYRELRKIAAGHIRRERTGLSLQTTDLVHEAYLKLVDQAVSEWRDRGHFFQVAAHVMRQILIPFPAPCDPRNLHLQ